MEFAPLDTIVQLSYDPRGSGWSWLNYGDIWEQAEFTPFIRLIGHKVVSLSLENEHVPNRFELANNYPNPFNPSTTIPYSIAENVHTEIQIYDLRGAIIRTLVNKTLQPGQYKIIWDGKNDNSTLMASGLYLVKMKAGDFTGQRKMLLIR